MSDVSALLDQLTGLRLGTEQWAEVEGELRSLDPSSPDAVRLSQIVFEARVQSRFQGGRSTTTLPPTKQTSALPWVGLVCALVLLAVGGALGGGLVFVGVVMLGVFVFGIAMAGSRVAHRSPTSPVVEEVPVEPPAGVVEIVGRLRPS